MDDEVRRAIEALPIHSIGGYEWECDQCHYHFAEREVIIPFQESRVIPKECPTCHATIAEDGEVDASGRPSDHETLLDRAAVLSLLSVRQEA